MTDSTEETDEWRFASGSEHLATPGQEAGIVPTFLANCDFFARFAKNMFFWQIMILQIVVGKLCVGKLHFGKLLPTRLIKYKHFLIKKIVYTNILSIKTVIIYNFNNICNTIVW